MGSSKDTEQGVVEGQPAYYGTFQGQPNLPQPAPPGGYYPPIYQPADDAQTTSNEETRLVVRGDEYQPEGKLPFCNLGFGWLLFILGFISVIPWYIGTFIYFCLTHDYRERSGLMACAIAALVTIILGGFKAGERGMCGYHGC